MSNSEARRTQLVELEQLDSLVSAAGIEGLEEILKAFWRSSDDLFALLKKHIAAAEFNEAARVAHALKGSSANVGASQLSEQIRRLEIACLHDNADNARNLLANAGGLYNESRIAFDDYLQNAS